MAVSCVYLQKPRLSVCILHARLGIHRTILSFSLPEAHTNEQEGEQSGAAASVQLRRYCHLRCLQFGAQLLRLQKALLQVLSSSRHGLKRQTPTAREPLARAKAKQWLPHLERLLQRRDLALQSRPMGRHGANNLLCLGQPRVTILNPVGTSNPIQRMVSPTHTSVANTGWTRLWLVLCIRHTHESLGILRADACSSSCPCPCARSSCSRGTRI